MNITLANLEKMGYREMAEVKDILTAYMEYGVPSDFYNDGATIEFNPNSGYVFLTNSEYQVAMLVGDRLESWYITPYNGHEGFIEDLVDDVDNSWNDEDIEFIANIVNQYCSTDLENKLKDTLKLMGRVLGE
jgi:hypothetical protein